MGKRVAFIAKTNLNNDGRILNQLKILQNQFKDVKIDFILMPDKPLTIDLGERLVVHTITTSFRNNKYFRILTVLEFSLKALLTLFKLRPEIIHVHDTAVVLPAYFYRLLVGNSFRMIYDDHEIPNERESIAYRIFHFFERRLMKKADVLIFANEERKEVLESSMDLPTSKTTYFLNLPYFETTDNADWNDNAGRSLTLKKLDNLIADGYKLIIHQGILDIERGEKELAAFSGILPVDVKILLVGINDERFRRFVEDYDLQVENFFCAGVVRYHELNEFWKRASASIILYLPTFINNRLCAPNRLYISFLFNIPIIVNSTNPVLRNFIENNSCGIFIEDLDETNIHTIFDTNYDSSRIEEMKAVEITKFENVYNQLFIKPR